MHRPILTSPPATDPVSLTEAKAHLRVDASDEDDLITALIAAASGHLDGHTGILGRCLVTQTWAQRYDGWSRVMRLPFPDISNIVLTYTDSDDAEQTVASSLYSVFEDSIGSYLRFSDSFTSPTVGPDYGGVSAALTAGYGAASAVPAALKAAILLHVGTLYENRESVVVGTSTAQLPHAHAALIAPYRRVPV